MHEGGDRRPGRAHRAAEGVRHFWASEMSQVPMEKTGNPRHVDLAWPLWAVLDMTPGGRGDDYPRLSYDG